MRALVRKFIRECAFCQKTDERHLPMGIKPFTLATANAMQTLNVDAIGPLPESEHGFRYILTVICTFTRWTMLYPLRTLEMVECAKALIQHFGIFGAPAVVSSDGGSQLKNTVVRETLDLIGARHKISIAYSSEENGIVERANKEALRHLRALVFDERTPEHWPDYLPFAQRICNAEVVSSIGEKPATLLFGSAINLDRSVLLPNKITPDHDHADKSAYVKQLIDYQHHAMDRAREHQQRLDGAHIVQRGAVAVTEFPVGSYVTLEYPDRAPHKLMTTRRGPYQVLRSEFSEYTIIEANHGGHEKEVHVSRLRRFNYDSTRTDPAEVVLADRSEYLVEAILDHKPKGTPIRSSQLSFRVQWLGFGPESNTWEPWANVRGNIVCHQYCRSHGMTSIIPASYR